MNLERIVRVLFKGTDDVSPAARNAEQGVDSFAKKTNGWIKSATDLWASWQLLSGAVRKIGEVIGDSIRSYDELQNSQRKLEGTAKLTGTALQDLQLIADLGRHAFGLSSVTANEFSAEISKLAQKAGETAKAKDALAAFLDIGAARGLSASQTLKAVQQSILGIDEGTDKLFGKNPSVLYGEFAEKIGTTAGKLTDQEKAQAILNAAMEGGIAVLGSYSTYLETTRGQADAFAQKNQEAAARLGESMGVVRSELLNVGGGVVPWFYDVWRRNFDGISATVFQAKGVVYEWIATVAKVLGQGDKYAEYAQKGEAAFAKYEEFYHRSKTSAGALAKETERVTGTLADVIPGAEKAGSAFSNLASPLDQSARLFEASGKAIGGIGPRANMSAKEIAAYGAVTVDTAKKTQTASEKLAAQAVKDSADATAATAAWERSHGLLKVAVEMTDGAIRRLSTTAHEQLPTAVVAEFERNMAAAAANAKLVEERLTGSKPLLESSADSSKSIADDIGTVARGALDAAQSFGVIDQKAASALTSAINIADSIGKMIAGGNVFAGVAGILGGVANIVSTMMHGDQERRALLRANSVALDKLRVDGVSLSTKARGDTIAKARETLTPELIDRITRMARGNKENALGFLNETLASMGLRMSDLDAIATDLGMSIRNKDGNLEIGTLSQLLAGLNTRGFGTSVGSSMNEQVRFFQESQRLSGATGATKISDFIGYLSGSGVSALSGIDMSNTDQARSDLFALRARLQNGGVDPASLGRLTGSQFADILAQLIDDINGLSSDTATAPGAPIGENPDDANAVDVLRDLRAVEARLLREDQSSETVRNELAHVQSQIAALVGGSAGAGGLPGTVIPPLSVPALEIPMLANILDGLLSFRDETVPILSQSLGVQIASLDELRGIRKAIEYGAALGYRNADDEVGRRLSVERRLQGNPAL